MSKEFLEIAKDSEDLVPRKLCWAMRWETHHRQNRSLLELVCSLLFVISIQMTISYYVSIPELFIVRMAIAIAFTLIFGLHWADARRNHVNAKITLERVRTEIGE